MGRTVSLFLLMFMLLSHMTPLKFTYKKADGRNWICLDNGKRKTCFWDETSELPDWRQHDHVVADDIESDEFYMAQSSK